MATSEPLTLKTIRNYVGDESFARGERYAQNGYISGVRKSGDTVKGTSAGSSGGPYRVQATVKKRNIVDSDCSCPIGGACKHVAALLITWLADPDDAPETPDPRAQLSKLSKAQLIEVIELMLEREPDLEDVLEVPLASADEASGGQTARPHPKNSSTRSRITVKPPLRSADMVVDGATSATSPANWTRW
ncbi:MAG: hypothetical protein HC853_11500 [Anaerolineae bacterium]|nr:hypothetical protein [Anaerolineae bacterium]